MIQGEVALMEKIIPSIEGKRRISRSEACDEVGLPCLDGTLIGIATILVSRHTLKID